MVALSPRVDAPLAPGDEVLDLTTGPESVVRLGSGLRQEGGRVVATRVGVLRAAKRNKLWLEGSQKRYLPAVDDVVVGTVTSRYGESFDVDVGGPVEAVLPVLSFEGATRRNRPNLQVGAAVYARVVAQELDRPPELSCMDAAGKASGFGALTAGYIFSCSSGLARALLAHPPPAVLQALASHVAFELAVGLNGRVWVHSASPSSTVLVCNALANAESLLAASSKEQEAMVGKLLEAVQRGASNK
eukprot:TRINITY_DN12662_c0_g1_i2.p1 TRINITY_DN12662_c0_g1~~TRINITY_DN12662_c0_g1_i2.p1  ORF type:complete len:245 (+),score=68.90 TRINITY_DN12662_c0_g1_i2:493-1227(+)